MTRYIFKGSIIDQNSSFTPGETVCLKHWVDVWGAPPQTYGWFESLDGLKRNFTHKASLEVTE